MYLHHKGIQSHGVKHELACYTSKVGSTTCFVRTLPLHHQTLVLDSHISDQKKNKSLHLRHQVKGSQMICQASPLIYKEWTGRGKWHQGGTSCQPIQGPSHLDAFPEGCKLHLGN